MTAQTSARSSRTGLIDPLFRMAILQGGVRAVEACLRRGFDPDARDGNGMTALMLAASKGHVEICRLLIEAGADPCATDAAGRGLLFHAEGGGGPLLSYVSALFGPPVTAGGAESRVSTASDDDDGTCGWQPAREPVRPTQDEGALRSLHRLNLDASLRRPLPGGAEWSDVPLFLPLSSHPPTAAALDARLRGDVERLLARALCAGRIHEADLVRVVRRHPSGSGRPTLEGALRTVLGDLGVLIDDSGPAPDHEPRREPPTEGRKRTIDDAVEFIACLLGEGDDELGRLGEEIRKTPLLEREDEIVLARRLREGLNEALAVVARSGSMLDVVIETGRAVLEGRAPLDAMVVGALVPTEAEEEPEPDDPPDREEPSDDALAEAVPLPVGLAERLQQVGSIRERMRAVGGPSADPGLARAMRKALRDLDPAPALFDALAALRSDDPRERRLIEEFRGSLQRVRSARDHFFKANLRLVVWMAKRYRRSGLEFADLVQEGGIGLLKACERFDPDRGNKFATVAIWWIRHAMSRAIADKSRAIRLPAHVFDQHRKISRLVRAGLDPARADPAAVANGIAVDERIVRRLLRVHGDCVPLDGIDPMLLERSLGEYDPAPSLEELVARSELRIGVERMILELPDREAEVVRRRFGLGGSAEHTLEEIGLETGVTRERIRQVEAKALGRLGHPLRRRWLREFL